MLREALDYWLTRTDNDHAGTAKVTAEGMGSYVGLARQAFEIGKAEVSDTEVVLAGQSFTYVGREIAPKPTVSVGEA